MSRNHEILSYNHSIRPEVRGAIARMDDAMRRREELRDVTTPIEFAKDLIEKGIIDDLAAFEDGLRSIGSPVHFIAAPPDTYGPDHTLVYPGDREGTPEYALIVGMKGPEEARRIKRPYMTNRHENLARLKRTGIPVAVKR